MLRKDNGDKKMSRLIDEEVNEGHLVVEEINRRGVGMSDLISKSELLKKIEKYKFSAISNDAEREFIRNTIIKTVQEQPTAYNIDKVVEELE